MICGQSSGYLFTGLPLGGTEIWPWRLMNLVQQNGYLHWITHLHLQSKHGQKNLINQFIDSWPEESY